MQLQWHCRPVGIDYWLYKVPDLGGHRWHSHPLKIPRFATAVLKIYFPHTFPITSTLDEINDCRWIFEVPHFFLGRTLGANVTTNTIEFNFSTEILKILHFKRRRHNWDIQPNLPENYQISALFQTPKCICLVQLITSGYSVSAYLKYT